MAFSQTRSYRIPRDLPPITPELREVIVGCVLGDLSILKGKRSDNARLQFAYGKGNSAYAYHIFSLFAAYCGSPPRLTDVSLKSTSKSYTRVTFNTLASPIFNEYRSLFYDSNGTEVVPSNIADLLTARSLAYWAMD
jgi:hypothetical protein